MALENGSDMVMPVAPMYGGGYGNGGFGFGGDCGYWLILFLFAMMGNGFGGWGGGFNGIGGMVDGILPYFYNTQTQNDVNRGFDNAGISNQLSGIQSAITSGFGDTALGIAGVNQNICSTGAGITAAINNGFAQAEIAENARQVANLQQAFASQTAITGGMNDLAMGLQNCCCENRAATADLKYTVANEACNTRFADANNTRDLLTAFNSGIQSLRDQLCDYRNEQKDDTIAQLRSELMYARGQASQDVQTAAIQAGQRALANEVEQYVNPTPIPAYMVTNPNCCANPCGCSGAF